MPVKDGPSCSGCGLPNYSGLCPHCSGDQQAYEDELVPPFSSSMPQPTELEECDECQGKGYYLIDDEPQVCVCIGDLDEADKVELWHKSDCTLPLSEWLGMTEHDFAEWIRGSHKCEKAIQQAKARRASFINNIVAERLR